MSERDVISDLTETLGTIADFAVGNGDVCEIIARRARAALRRADEAQVPVEAPAPAQPTATDCNCHNYIRGDLAWICPIHGHCKPQPAQPVASPKAGFEIRLLVHTTDGEKHLESPQDVRDILANGIENASSDLEEEIDFTLEVKRIHQPESTAVASPGAEEIAQQAALAAVACLTRLDMSEGDRGYWVKQLAEPIRAAINAVAASLEARHRTLLDNYDKMEAERDRLREIVRIGVEECGKAGVRADKAEADTKEREKWLMYIVLAVCDPTKMALGREEWSFGKAVEVAVDRLNAADALAASLRDVGEALRGLLMHDAGCVLGWHISEQHYVPDPKCCAYCKAAALLTHLSTEKPKEQQ